VRPEAGKPHGGARQVWAVHPLAVEQMEVLAPIELCVAAEPIP
jgi:hypothetical protein